MEKKIENRLFGLLGKDIDYSFSRKYFKEKFKKLNLLNCSYVNFDIPQINDFKDILKNKNISGINVTIPYKQEVISYLDELCPEAKQIGAVNTIQVLGDKLIGHNTDYCGFLDSIKLFLKPNHKKALVLGTGGASKAVVFALNNQNIKTQYVSSSGKEGSLSYAQITNQIMQEYTIIVNCTPLGSQSDVSKKPMIPYDEITSKHLLYDLIYNPSETAFLKEGKYRGATISNGYNMLEFQAEKSWDIWNKIYSK